ncbi:MAG TPA: hypothetical protein VNF47_04605 [Streptosporangiaceae bacterium]|nr:hypothetical protein [Streptosporangiaceae bacterium]
MATSRSHTVQDALALLASLPGDIADHLGAWTDTGTGELGGMCVREDWREGLLSGRVDPAAFIENARVMRWLYSPGALDVLADRAAAYRRRRFAVVDGSGAA